MKGSQEKERCGFSLMSLSGCCASSFLFAFPFTARLTLEINLSKPPVLRRWCAIQTKELREKGGGGLGRGRLCYAMQQHQLEASSIIELNLFFFFLAIANIQSNTFCSAAHKFGVWCECCVSQSDEPLIFVVVEFFSGFFFFFSFLVLHPRNVNEPHESNGVCRSPSS